MGIEREMCAIQSQIILQQIADSPVVIASESGFASPEETMVNEKKICAGLYRSPKGFE